MDAQNFKMLPKVDEVLSDELLSPCLQLMPREKVADCVRDVIDEFRKKILEGSVFHEEELSCACVAAVVSCRLTQKGEFSLKPVINATGVILHTNLGRSNLSEKAKEAVLSVAGSYSTLEYDPQKGERGSRHDHVEAIVKRITGAEAAMVVNNNAAATLLVMSVLGKGKEVIVSRGELVEIGGSFRIPDIMEQSGAILKEIGTTNKTHFADYERAINENTAVLLKVHTSNYKILGFTEDVGVRELRGLADKYSLPLIYDMGSGLMVDLSSYGISEPNVKQELKNGADVILFSGDKLLGGPQAGIIAGKKEYIDLMKKHPLARAIRVDKLTIAALEATFASYYNETSALKEIPVLRMISLSAEELTAKCAVLRSKIKECCGDRYSSEIIECEGLVGGGSAPCARLKNYALSLRHGILSPDALEEKLRFLKKPVIARIKNDCLLLDVRTIDEKDFDYIAQSLKQIDGECLS